MVITQQTQQTHTMKTHNRPHETVTADVVRQLVERCPRVEYLLYGLIMAGSPTILHIFCNTVFVPLSNLKRDFNDNNVFHCLSCFLLGRTYRLLTVMTSSSQRRW